MGQIGCGWNEQFGDALPALEFESGFVPEMMGMGASHSCFVSTNASMVCFGRNDYGQVRISCLLQFLILRYALLHQLGYGDTEHRGSCSTSPTSGSVCDFLVLHSL